MTRNELKAIVAKHPGWATVVVYGNNHNSTRLLYGPRYIAGVQHTRIPELDELFLNPDYCNPFWVDCGWNDAPDYRVDIPDEWEEDYTNLPRWSDN